jgi:hypothetical protein
MASQVNLEPTVLAIKEQTTKFREIFDQWCQKQLQQTEEEQACHRDVMKQVEGL